MHDDFENKTAPPGHEPLETDVRAVWRTAAVIVGVVIGACLLVIGLMNWFGGRGIEPPTIPTAHTEPGWEEQVPLQQLRIREQAWLDQYEWVDATAGVARIPVDRAMEIISQNGLEAAFPAAASADAAQRPAPPQNSRQNVQGNRP